MANHDEIVDLIDASSLGAPRVVEVRRRTPADLVRDTLARASDAARSGAEVDVQEDVVHERDRARPDDTLASDDT